MITTQSIAPHILRELVRAQRRGRSIDLLELASRIGVRRTDVRSAISAMHRADLVDALTMRLTLKGFALGTAYAKAKLPTVESLREECAAAPASRTFAA